MNLSLAIFHDQETAKEWGWVQASHTQRRWFLSCQRAPVARCTIVCIGCLLA